MATLQTIALDSESFEAEQEEAEKAERSVEDRLKGRVGVYVFTCPHYLRYPTHGGLEWFSTSVEFLDCIAQTLALEIVEVVPDNEL